MPTQKAVAPKQKPSDIQIVAKDIRQGAAVTDLAKKLFDPNEQLKLSPQLIASILRSAGLAIPPAAQVTADVAQIFLSGGAIVNNIQQGATLKSFAAPTSLVIRATSDLLSLAGLMPKDSPAAKMLDFGTSLAIVVACGGLNVLADLAFVFSVISNLFAGLPDRTGEYTEYAKNMAKNQGDSWFYTRETEQLGIATRLFQDYQEGRLHAFQFMGQIAAESPDFFLNFFPDLNYFLPPTISKRCFDYRFQKHETGGVFGLQSRDYDITQTYCKSWRTTLQNRKQLQGAFLKQFLLQPLYPYQKIDRMGAEELSRYGYPEEAKINGVKIHGRPVPRIRIQDLALLSMFPPYFQFVRGDFDIKPYLQNLQVTPFDLGYNVIEETLRAGDQNPEPPRMSGITFNGVEYQKVKTRSFKPLSAEDQQIVKLDQTGNINALLRNAKARAIITEWGLIPYVPQSDLQRMKREAYPPPLEYQATLRARIKVRAQSESVSRVETQDLEALSLNEDAIGYRNIQNYWSLIQMSTTIQTDDFFQDYAGMAEVKGLLPLGAELDAKHRDLQWLTVGRKMNALAADRVAGYYGVPTSKLRFLKPEEGKLAKVIVM